MARSNLHELQREAKRLGVSWADVEHEYREIRDHYERQRQRERAIRQTAWWALVGSRSGSAPFWRHGFASRFGRKLARGADYTCVPGYDDIRQTVAERFPEFRDPPGQTGVGCEELFDLLFSPWTLMPSREEMFTEALGRIEASLARQEIDCGELDLLAY